jgi:hypothetical protein
MPWKLIIYKENTIFIKIFVFFLYLNIAKHMQITVATWCKAWTVFARSNAGIVGSNPTQGMDVCVCVYSAFVLSCVLVAALRRTDHSSKESYRLCKKDYEA